MRPLIASYEAIMNYEVIMRQEQSLNKLSLHKLSHLQQPVAPCCEVTKQSRETKLKQETQNQSCPKYNRSLRLCPFAALA